MMGSRGMKNANEHDCLCRRTRRVLLLKPAAIRAAKRSFAKRMRRDAKLSAREEIANSG